MSPHPTLTKLNDRLQAATLRGLLTLPEQAQRRLAGPPVVRDGQTLATDTQLMLRLLRLAREPGVETLPIPAGRRALDRQTAMSAGRQPIGAVRSLNVAGRPARLYLPTGAATTGPTLLFLHGGGWVYGGLASHDGTCRFLAERSGVRVLAVDYRLAPEDPFPAAYDDARAAYRWLVDNARAVGADRDRLAVGGDSAGGCLAATTAIEAAREGLPLAFQLLVYPGTDHTATAGSRATFSEGFYLTKDFMDLATGSYVPADADPRDPRLSPLYADLPAELAPAYVATAGFDPLRDEGEAYAARLAEAGVKVELRRFEDQIHGFLNVLLARSSRRADEEIAQALRAGLA
ncbi:alpha/beta hydrolase [Nocardioides panaciterrulae]|uniref:Acetyl esterase n=1 Tax=Nocardioides panaciterrulae TaxID=661492 RepID=A0A7Y9E3B8_9ACTN|nr:acetyl esterase [Nocardioides panaciterrulae]